MTHSEKVTIDCYGGCGRSVTLRKRKVYKVDYYLCHSRQDGAQCEAKLPSLLLGKVRIVDMNAAASFWGYRDVEPDDETAASVVRPRDSRERRNTKGHQEGPAMPLSHRIALCPTSETGQRPARPRHQRRGLWPVPLADRIQSGAPLCLVGRGRVRVSKQPSVFRL